jgi:hypothetical protein
MPGPDKEGEKRERALSVAARAGRHTFEEVSESALEFPLPLHGPGGAKTGASVGSVSIPAEGPPAEHVALTAWTEPF